MAFVSVGITRCTICHKVIEEGQKFVAFPPLTSNTLDPLIIFSDEACHYDCFIDHPYSELALARHSEVEHHNKPPHLCTQCGLKITDPDDYFVLPHWTDNLNDELYKFNYLKFHKSHLSKWTSLSELHRLLLDLARSGTWGGKTLDYILNVIEKAEIQ